MISGEKAGRIAWRLYLIGTIPLAALCACALVACIGELPGNFHEGLAVFGGYSLAFLSIWGASAAQAFRPHSLRRLAVLGLANLILLAGLFWFGIEISDEHDTDLLLLYAAAGAILILIAMSMPVTAPDPSSAAGRKSGLEGTAAAWPHTPERQREDPF